MRLLVVLALVACGKGKTEEAKPAMDWARCEQQVRSLATVDSQAGTIEALIGACPVCGDWKPILDWNTPRTEGGPSREAIDKTMGDCNAWCEPKAREFFMGALDNVRGQSSRAPWKQLADLCKDKVSAAPDARFASAPYFALDRIARAVAAHGGDAAPQLAGFFITLPPMSATGSGIEVPEVDKTVDVANDTPIVTVLGDQLYVSYLPQAHLTAKGVEVVKKDTAYPGNPVKAEELKTGVVVAAKGMPAQKLLALLAPAKGATLRLAVRAHTKLPGWQMIAMIATPMDLDVSVDDKSTVQDLANTLARPR